MSKSSLYMKLIGNSTQYSVVETARSKRKNEARKERRKRRELSGPCVTVYQQPPPEDLTEFSVGSH